MTSPRSLRWGLTFIAAGLFWLLIRLDVISAEVFLYALTLWPLWLIAIGIEMIFKRGNLRALGYISPALMVGVFVLGCGGGVILAAPLLEPFWGSAINILLVIGVLSGILSIFLVKVMIVVITAVTGAFRVVFGASYLMGGYNFFDAITDPESLPTALAESDGLFWTMAITAAAGILVQFHSRKRRRTT